MLSVSRYMTALTKGRCAVATIIIICVRADHR